MLQSHPMQITSITETSSKDVSKIYTLKIFWITSSSEPVHYFEQGLTIMWSKRGGDVFSYSHSKWLQTITANPEPILFKFVPITSLLSGVPGSGYLSHAINLYLRCEFCPVILVLLYLWLSSVCTFFVILFIQVPFLSLG